MLGGGPAEMRRGEEEAKGTDETVRRRKGQARKRLQECLERRRTGPQQYTTKRRVWGGE